MSQEILPAENATAGTPVVTIQADTVTIKESVVFVVNATDSDSNVVKLEYSTDGGDTWTDCVFDPGQSVTVSLTADVNNTTYLFRAGNAGGAVSETQSVTFDNIYSADAEKIEINGLKRIVDEQSHTQVVLMPASELVITADGTLISNDFQAGAEAVFCNNNYVQLGEVTLAAGADFENNGVAAIGTLNMYDSGFFNHDYATMSNLVVSGKYNVLSGRTIDGIRILELASGSELAVTRDQYDNMLENTLFANDTTGGLIVGHQEGSDLTPADIQDVVNKTNLNNVTFAQDVVNIGKLTLPARPHAFQLGFQKGYGTASSDKITIEKNAKVTLTAASIDLAEGKNTVAIKSNAVANFITRLSNIAGITVESGKTAKENGVKTQKYTEVAMGSVDFSENYNSSLAIGQFVKFTGANVTGHDKNDKITIDANSNVTLCTVELGGGADAFSIGTGVSFSAEKLNSAEKITLDKYSDVQIGIVRGVQKLTVNDGSRSNFAKLTATTVSSTEAKDNFSFGNYNIVALGKIALGDGDDTVKFGSYASGAVTSLDFGAGADAFSIGTGASFSAEKLNSAEKITLGKYSDVQIGDVQGVQKLTVNDGSKSNFAKLNAAIVSGTEANDNFIFGSYNSLNLGKVALGDGDDTMKFGSYASGAVTSLDFGAGADAFSIGTGASFSAEKLNSAEKITLGKYSDVKIEEVVGVQKLTMNDGSKSKFAKLNAAIVSGTEANDKFTFGSYNNLDLGKVALGDGDDTVKFGSGVSGMIQNLDFGAGDDTLVIGKNCDLWINGTYHGDLNLKIGTGCELHLAGDLYSAVTEAFASEIEKGKISVKEWKLA